MEDTSVGQVKYERSYVGGGVGLAPVGGASGSGKEGDFASGVQLMQEGTRITRGEISFPISKISSQGLLVRRESVCASMTSMNDRFTHQCQSGSNYEKA